MCSQSTTPGPSNLTVGFWSLQSGCCLILTPLATGTPSHFPSDSEVLCSWWSIQFCITSECKGENSGVATNMNNGVASISSSLILYESKTVSMWIRGTFKNIAAFQRWTLERARTSWPTPNLSQGHAPKFPHGWFNIFSSPGYPSYDWVDHSYWMHRKSSAKNVSHSSTVPSLGGSTLEFPWDPG